MLQAGNTFEIQYHLYFNLIPGKVSQSNPKGGQGNIEK